MKVRIISAGVLSLSLTPYYIVSQPSSSHTRIFKSVAAEFRKALKSFTFMCCCESSQPVDAALGT